MNRDGVLVSGADNGTLYFWDWRTGYNFQKLQAPVQPGKDIIYSTITVHVILEMKMVKVK